MVRKIKNNCNRRNVAALKNAISILLFFFCTVAYPQAYSSVRLQKKIDSLEQAVLNSKEDTTRIVLYNKLAKAYQNTNRLKSFDIAKQALSLSQKLNDKNKTGQSLNYLGDLYWYSGDYASASDFYFKALKIYEDMNDLEGIAECYRNIGWIYQGQNLFDKTIEYYKKSLDINLKLHKMDAITANYDDLSIVYKMAGNYSEALIYCNKTIELSKKSGVIRNMATGYGNLAALYTAMGNYSLAIENYLTANSYKDSIQDSYNTAEGYNGMATCYYKLENYKKSIEYAAKALYIAKKYDYKTTETASYKLLASAYSAKKDFSNAYNYLSLFTALQDSTYNEKNSRQINEMSAKYESEKKELTINSLEKDKAKDEQFKIYMIVFCFVIAVFMLFLFRGFLQNKKPNNSLSLAYKEIEVKNKDINDSINYAKQIQRARLSNPSIILNHIPEAFGLYKPKDVVSGDFYWFAEHENGKLMLVAGDCTGHGIPGAFMSLIGIDELNHAALEKRLDNASEILSSVNKGVKKALRQNEQNSMSRDGMDLALCIFDLKNNTLEYAAANRPFYYIRDNQLNEITPTKAAIGGLTPNDQEFKNHIIEMKKGDMIYVFTDGFADQFGGPEGKKFMTKRFKELLLSIHLKPIPEQETLLEKALNDWKKGISQVDDILVLGVRI
ncbi:MAG: tetratricopeptide repeat protein [Bacteroidia bacterium]